MVAVRIVARPGDEARVIFLVARISDDAGLGSNINARYTVESVEIRRPPGARDQRRRCATALQALVGSRLDPAEADRLVEALKAELPGYDVTRRIERGTRRGRIRVVFEFTETEELRWIPFARRGRSSSITPTRDGAALHDIPMGDRDHRVTFGFALDDNDTWSRSTRASASASRPGTSAPTPRPPAWRCRGSTTPGGRRRSPRSTPTRAIPEPYRQRFTVEPSLTVALTRHVRASGGVSLSSLESLHQLAGLADGERRDRRRSSTASAGTATGAPGRTSRPATSCGRRSTGSAATSTTRGTSAGRATEFESRAQQRHRRGLCAAASPARRRSSNASRSATPRRSAAGTSSTLAPDRRRPHVPPVARVPLPRRRALPRRGLGVGRRRADSELRASTGFGFHTDHVFLTVAFPLNAPEHDATFMMGVRF